MSGPRGNWTRVSWNITLPLDCLPRTMLCPSSLLAEKCLLEVTTLCCGPLSVLSAWASWELSLQHSLCQALPWTTFLLYRSWCTHTGNNMLAAWVAPCSFRIISGASRHLSLITSDLWSLDQLFQRLPSQLSTEHPSWPLEVSFISHTATLALSMPWKCSGSCNLR